MSDKFILQIPIFLSEMSNNSERSISGLEIVPARATTPSITEGSIQDK